jgi:hypothetical protein
MLDNAFRIAVDPMFPQPYTKRYSIDCFTENKFELVFNEFVDAIEKPPPDLLSEDEEEIDDTTACPSETCQEPDN